MFYDTSWVAEEGTPTTRAIVLLTPAESKRLIGKAVAALPEVRNAFQRGRLIIARGTTDAFVAEEITGESVDKSYYASGIVTKGKLGTVPLEERQGPFGFKEGKPANPDELIKEFEPDDVFIKGANAVDRDGVAGIFMANPYGGTIGGVLPIVAARGSHLIMPVGLEKLIPSVIEASRKCGNRTFKYTDGMAVGLMPVVNGKVVTEVQAIKVLTGATATHVGSGGVGGWEGCVTLVLEGSEETVKRAWDLVQSIKGEPQIPGPARLALESR
jgi:hypothetical protein